MYHLHRRDHLCADDKDVAEHEVAGPSLMQTTMMAMMMVMKMMVLR